MAWQHLTDTQWEVIAARLPRRKYRPQGGRRPVSDRKCFEGILWILKTGAPWAALPTRYGSKSAVHRRLCQWAEDGTLLNLWRWFLEQLSDHQKIQWHQCFVDGTFAPAKKGGLPSEKPSGAREPKSWSWQMAEVLRSEFPWRRPPRRKSVSSSKP
jgi:transposase